MDQEFQGNVEDDRQCGISEAITKIGVLIFEEVQVGAFEVHLCKNHILFNGEVSDTPKTGVEVNQLVIVNQGEGEFRFQGIFFDVSVESLQERVRARSLLEIFHFEKGRQKLCRRRLAGPNTTFNRDVACQRSHAANSSCQLFPASENESR